MKIAYVRIIEKVQSTLLLTAARKYIGLLWRTHRSIRTYSAAMKKTVIVAKSATSKIRSSRRVGRQLLESSARLMTSKASSNPWNRTVSDSGLCRTNDRTKNRPKPKTNTSDAARSRCWSSRCVSEAIFEPLPLMTR